MDYTANQSAQGLASLGRGNDSMLVHMTPREVQGLQGLAMAHGGSLTINPQTGLPEAGFLDAVLPMAAGFALGPGGFGLFQGANAALMAGLTVGGLTALASGDIGKGLMAGFGAYGGSGLGEAVKGFGAQAAAPGAGTTGEFVGDALAANKINVMNPSGAPGVNVFSGAGAPGVNLPKFTGATGFGPSAVGNTSFLGGTAGAEAVNPKNLLDLGAGSGTTSATNLIRPGASSMPLTDQSLSQGFSNVLSDPSGFAKEYGTGKLALQGGSLALEALNPKIEPEPLYVDPDRYKYRSSTGGLSLSDKFDTGLRLAQGGTIDTGGIRDLYGSRDDQLSNNLSRDGYGLGRLNNLANQQSLAQAQTTGYAEGGDVGMNLNELPSLNLNTGSSSMPDNTNINAFEAMLLGRGPGYGAKGPSLEQIKNMYADARNQLGGINQINYSNRPFRGLDPGIVVLANAQKPTEFSPIDYPQSRLNPGVQYLANQQSLAQAQTTGYAEGGETHMNINDLPTLNVNTGEQIAAGKGLSRLKELNPIGALYNIGFGGMLGNQIKVADDADSQNFFYGTQSAWGDDPQSQALRKLSNSLSLNPVKPSGTVDRAKGGYLDGAGDGMSDSIPATIEGKQPARLADGEFVVPADVVSHLGNGSSKAGSKRLYAMLDKVRHARTGNKKQGKEIKPEKYMPA